MATFATVLDMSPPMNKDNFDAINDKRHDAYVSGATKGMKRAALEEMRNSINATLYHCTNFQY